MKKKFHVERVKSVTMELLEAKLKNRSYDPSECSKLVKDISNELLSRVKALEFDRYKLMIQVVIGEMLGQGSHFGSRGLWDHENDNYASSSFKNETLYCVATVFGCYTP